jgi:DNA-binding transcriptional regulator GbsR (MarR family)
MKPRTEQLAYVERVARWWEGLTASRNAGKILGWLMICEPPHQSSSDLVDALGISTGSVSTHIRGLVDLGLVERVTFAGDRATYFQLKDHVWSAMMWSEQARIEEMRGLTEDVAEVLPAQRPDRVTDLGQVIEFVAREWPEFMRRMSEFLEKERTS